jgi:hypothetical protein
VRNRKLRGQISKEICYAPYKQTILKSKLQYEFKYQCANIIISARLYGHAILHALPRSESTQYSARTPITPIRIQGPMREHVLLTGVIVVITCHSGGIRII